MFQPKSTLPLLTAHAYYDQTDPGYKGKSAQDWRNRESFGLLMRYLKRAQINIFFFVSKADSTHRKADDAQKNQ